MTTQCLVTITCPWPVRGTNTSGYCVSMGLLEGLGTLTTSRDTRGCSQQAGWRDLISALLGSPELRWLLVTHLFRFWGPSGPGTP